MAGACYLRREITNGKQGCVSQEGTTKFNGWLKIEAFFFPVIRKIIFA